jgi:hypothetical protein
MAPRVPIPPNANRQPDNPVSANRDDPRTVHSPSSDLTQRGQGTLIHTLIDAFGQPTDHWSWMGDDGTLVTQTPSGTMTESKPDGTVIQQSASGVITQTNPDGSAVTYNPNTKTVSTTDGKGTRTTFHANGSIEQRSRGLHAMWDAAGDGWSLSRPDGLERSSPAPAPPTKPAIPPSIAPLGGPNSPGR